MSSDKERGGDRVFDVEIARRKRRMIFGGDGGIESHLLFSPGG